MDARLRNTGLPASPAGQAPFNCVAAADRYGIPYLFFSFHINMKGKHFSSIPSFYFRLLSKYSVVSFHPCRRDKESFSVLHSVIRISIPCKKSGEVLFSISGLLRLSDPLNSGASHAPDTYETTKYFILCDDSGNASGHSLPC